MNSDIILSSPGEASLEVSVSEKVELIRVRARCEAGFDAENALSFAVDIPDGARITAIQRHSPFWCRPVFVSEPAAIPGLTQGLIWEKDGEYGVMWTLAGDRFRCFLEAGRAVLSAGVGGVSQIDEPALVRARGRDVFALLEACARRISQIKGIPLRSGRSYPDILEYPGWCSWDAFQIRVSHEDLVSKARELKNTPVKWCLIDDMWGWVKDFYGKTYDSKHDMILLMHASRLWELEADPIRFPHGLAGAVEDLHALGFGVGMWYPIPGYWKGADPAGGFFEKVGDCLIESRKGALVPAPEYKKAKKYFDTVNGFLKSAGADFVKIDFQSIYDSHYKGIISAGEAAKALHGAREDSAKEFFGDAVIDCMGLSVEDQQNRAYSAVCRCSDDFQPEDRAWFAKHITQCSFNGLFTGQFYVCDWDMWWTDDGQAKKNSLLRAISGGPVYVSDMLGRTHPELLEPLVGDDGRILRCDRPAMPSADCIMSDPASSGRVFKVTNVARGAGYVAVFDLDSADGPVSGTVSPSDVPELGEGTYAVWEHFTGEFFILDLSEKQPVSLSDPDDFRLYKFVKLVDGAARFGRTDKFVSTLTAGLPVPSGVAVLSVSGGEPRYFTK